MHICLFHPRNHQSNFFFPYRVVCLSGLFRSSVVVPLFAKHLSRLSLRPMFIFSGFHFPPFGLSHSTTWHVPFAPLIAPLVLAFLCSLFSPRYHESSCFHSLVSPLNGARSISFMLPIRASSPHDNPISPTHYISLVVSRTALSLFLTLVSCLH